MHASIRRRNLDAWWLAAISKDSQGEAWLHPSAQSSRPLLKPLRETSCVRRRLGRSSDVLGNSVEQAPEMSLVGSDLYAPHEASGMQRTSRGSWRTRGCRHMLPNTIGAK
jgi:hypothetical protein